MDTSVKKPAYTVETVTDSSSQALRIKRNGKTFLTLPICAKINGEYCAPKRATILDSSMVFEENGDKMTFDLQADHIVVSFEKAFSKKDAVREAKLFCADSQNRISGITLEGFDRSFCPQPRNNQRKNLAYFNSLPNVSEGGYFSPPVLEFAIGSPLGWVSFGLLDIPDTKICKMDSDLSFLVELCGENKVIEADGVYKMPRVIITFPKDELDSIALFRKKLTELGLYTPGKPKYSEIPTWWKNPFICTYGDQILENRVGQLIDTRWVQEIVDITQRDYGLEKINLIIDDSWQLPHAFEGVPDKKRFPDLREFIDLMHQKGSHVILWQTPLFDNTSNGFVTKAQKYGVLDKKELKYPVFTHYFDKFPGCYCIDYTSDNARLFIRDVCESMFGNGEGQLNADGIKLDFMAILRDPAAASYANPSRGIGYNELYLFYEMFYTEAKRVKPDVLIDCTVGDPRFEQFVDFNRLHDTHSGNMEKEIRAAIASTGCPDLIIDSDGCWMFNSWLKDHYISCAVYGVPSDYYVKKYQDYHVNNKRSEKERLPDHAVYLRADEKLALGNLFKMSAHRPDGTPVFDSLGNWRLMEEDTVNAVTVKGETVVYYPTASCDTGYIFTFMDEAIMIPLHQRRMALITPEPLYAEIDYARDRAILRLTPGVIHTFKNENDGSGIENNFISISQPHGTAEEQMNYVN